MGRKGLHGPAVHSLPFLGLPREEKCDLVKAPCKYAIKGSKENHDGIY